MLSVAMISLLCGCLGGGEKPQETVKTGPETGADSPEIRDSDVPLIEESDSVAVGTMLPEAPEEEPASPPEDVQAGVLEEGDVVEIGEML